MTNGGELYRRFLCGDSAAFDALMEGYHDGLILFLRRFVGNYADAEELAQDTFAELLIRKPRFAGKSDFRTFLYAIGRHKAIDYIRRESRRRIVSPEEIGELYADTYVEDAYIADAEKRALHRAITSLSPDAQDAVWLVYFEELSYADAAHILGKSEKQIDNLIYRAKGALRKLLSEGGDHRAG